MRITTQMVNESAKKAGMPIHNSSLLSYINQDSGDNTLLGALNKNQQATKQVNETTRNNYEALEKAADKLVKNTAILMQEDENGLFAQAKESGDYQKIYESVEGLFEDYNSTLKNLKKLSGTMNQFYSQMLSEAPFEMKESLSSVGISFDKDGSAKVDMEKLKATDVETLEKLFGSKSDFIRKLNFVSTRVLSNAEANVESFSNAYGANGSLYSGVPSSKYDFLG